MKTVTLKLDMAEIIYDVQNKTYLTGKSRSNGDNHEHVANMQANDDDENANQILRSIGSAFSLLKTKLSEYLDMKQTTVSNELITAETTLELVLSMPSNYNTSTAETLVAAAHAFIVGMAIADWFVITNKTDAPEYISGAETSLKVITEAVNKRVRPIRKTVGNQ